MDQLCALISRTWTGRRIHGRIAGWRRAIRQLGQLVSLGNREGLRDIDFFATP
jgi:hypothetical protein